MYWLGNMHVLIIVSVVQSLPRMIIKDEIGKQVKLSLEAAKLTQNDASQGIYDASVVSTRHARSLAEDAFFHPSVMSISYYSFEHCFAVYSKQEESLLEDVWILLRDRRLEETCNIYRSVGHVSI